MRLTHTQSAFDKYAYALGEALQAYPHCIRWHPSGSCETFAARFRDAVKAGLRYGYTSSHVDTGLFREHGAKLKVSLNDDDTVLIGTATAIKSYNELHVPVGAKTLNAPVGNEIEVEISDLVVAVHLCQLIQMRAFKTPVAFVVGPLSPGDAGQLEADYDVTLVPVPGKPNIYTLL